MFARKRTSTIEKMVYDALCIHIIAEDKYSYKIAEIKNERVYEYDLVHNGLNKREFLIELFQRKMFE